MLLVILALVCIATVPLAGGKLTALSSLEVRAVPAALLSAALQIGVTSAVRGGDHSLHVALHLASYGLVAWFLVANRRIVAMPVIALGAVLNMVAIAANAGVMPAANSALRIAGIDTSGGFSNSAATAHPHLLVLGDIIPVPGPWPIGNVLSIGDLLIFAGALVLLHRTCRPAIVASSPAAGSRGR